MSPYLFVIAMEVLHLLLMQRADQSDSFHYHWHCKEVNLLNLCFADDLLLFCKADEQSVLFFREGLETFAQWSGLKEGVPVRKNPTDSVSSLGLEHILAMAFILPKRIIKLIEARIRKFLWQGGTTLENDESIWVTWIRTYRLKNNTVWTANPNSGSWCWRKILRLRGPVLNYPYEVGPGSERMVWKDLGTLWGYLSTGSHGDHKSVGFRLMRDLVSNGYCSLDFLYWFYYREAYRLFNPPGPKVSWFSLLLGPYHIARNNFVLWLAILGRLATLDRPWWQGTDRTCILCTHGEIESHDHLFFRCDFSRQCLRILKWDVKFSIPVMAWRNCVEWARRRWRGRHPLNAASRALFASLVYHLWKNAINDDLQPLAALWSRRLDYV
ncbi:UNVERIFIED_CONTAM: hypothetical protein Slati_2512500 [Sesamum latifolium]|uniref:Reverse transcriptase zinc-binding domain-containing protein n=1 Tax=Sesamum latifolium TaxID=2727402 RepID=A0AAW2WJA8_9LAMI